MITTKTKLNVATAFVFIALFGFSSVYAQLGGLKNAAKNAASKTIESKPKEEKKNETSTNSNSPKVHVKIDKDETGYDLAAKGDKSYEAEKWADALAYYEEAENRGYQDGMVKKRMNECRDNMDSAKQKENEEATNKGNSIFNDIQSGAIKMKPKMNVLPAVQDDGITSDVHKKYIKQIVFSKSEIAKTGASETAFTNTFNLGDDIFLRSFIEKSTVNEFAAMGAEKYHTSSGRSTILRIYVDGKLFVNMPGTDPLYADPGEYFYFAPIGEDYSLETSTTFMTALSRNWGTPGDKGTNGSMYLLDFFYNTWQLSAGAHKIKLDFILDIPSNGATSDQQYTTAFGEEKVLSTGEFTLNVTEAAKVTTGKKICSMPDVKYYIDNYNFKSPAATKAPKASEWVKSNLIEKSYPATLLKVVEAQNWDYIRNSYGIITHRILGGTVFLQDNETKLYYGRGIKFTEQNISSGGDKYGQTVWEWQDDGNIGIRFCKECLAK